MPKQGAKGKKKKPANDSVVSEHNTDIEHSSRQPSNSDNQSRENEIPNVESSTANSAVVDDVLDINVNPAESITIRGSEDEDDDLRHQLNALRGDQPQNHGFSMRNRPIYDDEMTITLNGRQPRVLRQPQSSIGGATQPQSSSRIATNAIRPRSSSACASNATEAQPSVQAQPLQPRITMSEITELMAFWDQKLKESKATAHASAPATVPAPLPLDDTDIFRSPRVSDKTAIYIDGLNTMAGRLLSPNFEHLPVANVAVMLDTVQKYWQGFQREYEESYNIENRVELARIQARADGLYTQAAATLTERIEQLSRQNETLNPSTPRRRDSSRNRTVGELRLKKVEIQPFGGDFAEWPVFKSYFEEYYHNSDLAKNTKMFMLRQHLKQPSEAFNLIRGFDQTGDYYETAWDTLKKTYDDDRKILEAHFIEFLDLPQISDQPSRQSMMNLVTHTRTLLNSMPKFGVDTSHWGVCIVPILVRKLDRASQLEWGMKRPPRVKPEIEPLLEFMARRAEGIDIAHHDGQTQQNWHRATASNAVDYPNYRQATASNAVGHQNYRQAAGSNAASRQYYRQTGANNASSHQSPDPTSNRTLTRRCPDPLCRYPNNNHQLFRCHRLLALDLDGRKRKVNALGVCKKCLKKQCHNCKMADCDDCNQPHNRLLCPRKNLPPLLLSRVAPAPLTATASLAKVNASHGKQTIDDGALLATAVIQIRDSNGALIKFRALIDSGSHINMITTNAHQRLRLCKPAPAAPFHGIGGNESKSLGTVRIDYAPTTDSECKHFTTAYVIKKITSKLPQQHFATTSWSYLNGLALADPDYNVPGEIDILLGAPALGDIMLQGMKRGGKNEPIAQNTVLGWIVFGKTHIAPTRAIAMHSMTEPLNCDDISTTQLLMRMWELEKVSERHVRTKSEQFCEDHFMENTTRTANGRYVVRIPIDKNASQLGESRSIALRRWLQMEQRFVKSPELKESYKKFMSEYLALGHMVPCESLRKGEVGCYIPHHAAGTTKFRVVFDGSCRTSNGVSLNDIQLTGEKLQPDLTTTTMRFRTHRYALCADIKKMYRQVLVPEDQQTFQRILYRENSDGPLLEFKLATQTYGLRSAPHNCVRALKQCAIDYAHEFPEVSMIAQRDFYIDDLITGADSEAEVLNIHKDMVAMLSKGCFELAKWNSNSWYVDSSINSGDLHTEVPLDKENDAENSVLGLKWNAASDVLKYSIKTPKSDGKLTMKKVVSHAASLYDPNGYLSPVTVVAKMFIQKLWIEKCTWDGKIPVPLINEWQKFVDDLPALSAIQIPRWIGTGTNIKSELHAFSDASTNAFGCAFYIKTSNDKGDTKVSLVMARSRVAPLKRTTIPRMELCGAHLMAKLLAEVRIAHNIEIRNCHLWTDSMIVLHWLENTPTNAKVFIANRVSETDELSRGCTWRHVSTNDNPADLVSRGIHASKLKDSSIWWHGPEWLRLPASQWPTAKTLLSDELKAEMATEVQSNYVLLATKEESPFQINGVDLLLRYSSTHKLFRVTAYVLRFLRCIRTKVGDKSPLSTNEIVDAEEFWVKQSQNQFFAKELEAVRQSAKKMPTYSKLIGLKPFIAKNGLLRASGRLDNAMLPEDIAKPILLHPLSRLAQLMTRSAHRRLMHGGCQATMQYVRSKYWIPGLRGLTRKTIHSCATCARYDAKPLHQMMGALPKVRVTPAKAFLNTGVDYCGPFNLKARAGKCHTAIKAYAAVFVCMATKAVHIELVSDLTSKSFLAALTRFTSRRGRVQALYSDNGTTFHGADAELTAAVKAWKKLSTDDDFQSHNIKWTFIPPVAPHQGGLWEAAVKSAKNHVKRVVGTQWLTFEELATVLASVEACLNSRPIGIQSDDASDNLALTPGDLIGTGPPIAPLSRDLTTTPPNRIVRTKLVEQMQQRFWYRWQREYVEALLARSKWKTEQPNAAVGDVVLLCDDNTPPNQWPMGIITVTYPGPDGMVRSVDVRSKGKTYRRPIVKLVPLPAGEDD